MSQRVGGAALLLVAAIILVLTQVSAGPDVPGTATRAPLPLPPPIGSCLSGPDNIVVPCDQPHEREVTFSWSADSAQSAGDNRTQQCGDSAGTYLGMTIQTPGQGWFANGPQYLTNYIPAPLDERVGLLGWGACVVQGSLGETYRGSARGGAQEPAAYGSCFNGAPTDIIAPNVGCSHPHVLQILASQTGFVADDPSNTFVEPFPTADELQASCLTLAAKRLQTADPTYGGQLEIESVVSADVGGVGTIVVFSQEITEDGDTVQTEITGTPQVAYCLVGAASPGLLTDTLIGNGSKPLPVK